MWEFDLSPIRIVSIASNLPEGGWPESLAALVLGRGEDVGTMVLV